MPMPKKSMNPTLSESPVLVLSSPEETHRAILRALESYPPANTRAQLSRLQSDARVLQGLRRPFSLHGGN